MIDMYTIANVTTALSVSEMMQVQGVIRIDCEILE